jgi:hypothetical protein
MKSKVILPAVLGCLCLSVVISCEKESVHIDKENSFNVSFKSTLNEQVMLKNEEAKIAIQVKNISDNRCPTHVSCADAGEATVRIEVSNINNAKAESLLHIGGTHDETKSSDSVTVNLDGRLYTIYLMGVNPHPIEASTEIQTAEIRVNLK